MARQQLEAARAQLEQAIANDIKAQNDVGRYKQLVDKQEISHQQYDQAVAAARSSAAGVAAARAQRLPREQQVSQAQAKREQAEANLRSAETAPQQMRRFVRAPRLPQAQAQQKKAELDQAHAESAVHASWSRRSTASSAIARWKSARTSQIGQELMKIINLDDIWVTANFKETQLRYMRPGQRATISVDAYGKKYNGHVESIAGASGALFSLLPPENATGNYVKVVQRIPVKITFDPGETKEHILRPGMSVEPKVWMQMSTAALTADGSAPAASGGQSLDHRAGGDAGHVHGGAGHQHRQRVAAAHRRQPFRRHRREHLGADLLPGFQRHRAAAERLDLVHHRAQALLHELRGHLHRQLVPVRAGAEPGHADFLPHPARRGRRRLAAQRAGDSGGHVSSRETRHGVRGLRHGGGAGAGHRPHSGRLDHRQLHLALDLSPQHSGRHSFAASDFAPDSGSAVSASARSCRKPRSTTSASAWWRWAWARCRLSWTRASAKTGSNRISSSILSVIAAASLLFLIYWEWTRKDPVIDLHLFTNRTFAASNMLMFMLGFALLGSTVLLPLFMQTLLGYTAEQSGLALLPGGFQPDAADAAGGLSALPLRRRAS